MKNNLAVFLFLFLVSGVLCSRVCSQVIRLEVWNQSHWVDSLQNSNLYYIQKQNLTFYVHYWIETSTEDALVEFTETWSPGISQTSQVFVSGKNSGQSFLRNPNTITSGTPLPLWYDIESTAESDGIGNHADGHFDYNLPIEAGEA